MGQLTLGVERVGPHRDRAKAGRRIEGDQELRAVGKDQSDTVAAADSEPVEGTRELLGLEAQLAVGQPLAEEADRGRVRKRAIASSSSQYTDRSG
jgi:hypothetical protein